MIKGKKGEVDWSSPETLVKILLAIILGLVVLYFIWMLRGKIMP